MKRHIMHSQLLQNRKRPQHRYQYGGSLPTFQGVRIQRGYGLGSLFGSLARAVMPLFRTGAKSVSKAAVRTGMNIANDVMSGRDFKSAAKARVGETGKQLMNNAVSSIQSRFKPQTGKGLKRTAMQTPGLSTHSKRARTSKNISQRRKSNVKKKGKTRRTPTTTSKRQTKKQGVRNQDIFGV